MEIPSSIANLFETLCQKQCFCTCFSLDASPPGKAQSVLSQRPDKFALYHFLQFRKVDINDLIFNKTCYPYGMLLTRLIRNKGITLYSEILNEIPILYVATLTELGLKNEAG